MLRNLPVIIVICAGIAGCATKPAPIQADNTPLNRTAVIEQQVVSNGIKGFFPFETTDRRYVRADMRRDETTFKGTGTFTRFLAGLRSDTEITRIDRKLHWSLNTEKQEYTECPLKGCIKPTKQPAEQKQPAEKPPQEKHEPSCTMRVVHSSFKAKSTGHKKTINGFDTREYQAVWVVRLRDNSARKSTSTLKLDIWTTPITGAMRDALEVERRYARAFNGAVLDTGKREIMPADAARLISAYLANSMKPGDLRAFLRAGREMNKVKGYPVSTHLAWNMEGNACASTETPSEAKDKSTSAPGGSEDMLSELSGMFAQKKADDTMKEAAGEPILSLTFELKKLGIEQVHDSVFTVPKNYKLVSQP
jgi:hypothetical protein